MKRYPLIEEIRTPLNAPQVFDAFREQPFSFFLDSGMDPGKLGRYSFMGSDPFLVLRSRGEEVARQSMSVGLRSSPGIRVFSVDALHQGQGYAARPSAPGRPRGLR